jgi:hypothetical protein
MSARSEDLAESRVSPSCPRTGGAIGQTYNQLAAGKRNVDGAEGRARRLWRDESGLA